MTSESVRQEVLGRDRGRCQLFHCEPAPASEVVYVRPRKESGNGPGSAAERPENLISVCAECHQKLHGPGIPWQVVQWRPLDPASLEVVDPAGRRVPHEELWFYQAKQWHVAEGLLIALRHSVRALRDLRWWMADTLVDLKETRGYRVGGYDDLYALGHELGMSSAEVKRQIRAAQFRRESGHDLSNLDPDVVDVLRKVPDAEFGDMVGLFADHPPPEAWKTFHDRYGRERMRIYRRFRVVGGKVAFEEIRAPAEASVGIEPGEVVVRGGSVIEGASREEE